MSSDDTRLEVGARLLLAMRGLTKRDVERWGSLTRSRFEGVVQMLIGLGAGIAAFNAVLWFASSDGLTILFAIGAGGLAMVIAPILAMGHLDMIFVSLFPTAARVDAFFREWELETERRRQAATIRWQTLDGRAFELALADVLRRLDYSVEVTPYSRDGGIDLVVRRDGRTWLVQCKATKSPAGVAAMRDLYGALTASSANAAVLAATSGVTSGAAKFARGKPLGVIRMQDLLALADGRDVLAEMWQRPITATRTT